MSGCGVASFSRLLKVYVSFAKEPYKKRLYSAKETCNFKKPINQSHTIPCNFPCNHWSKTNTDKSVCVRVDIRRGGLCESKVSTGVRTVQCSL